VEIFATNNENFWGESIMRVAISSRGKGLDSLLDPRFCKCTHFVIVEMGDMKFEAFDNGSRALGGEDCIQFAKFVASKGVKTVITGHCGPDATEILSAARIELYLKNTKSVRDAINKYIYFCSRPEYWETSH